MSFIDFYQAWSVHYLLLGRPFQYLHYNGYGWITDRCQN